MGRVTGVIAAAGVIALALGVSSVVNPLGVNTAKEWAVQCQESNSQASCTPATRKKLEKFKSLMPYAFVYGGVDSVFHSKEGAGQSCMLHVLYNMVLVQQGRKFDFQEFSNFRKWAAGNKLFDSRLGVNGPNSQAIAARLPQFFGPGVSPLVFSDALNQKTWTKDLARKLDQGALAVAFLDMARWEGETTMPEDALGGHAITILAPTTDRVSGKVSGFFYQDADYTHSWATVSWVASSALENALIRKGMDKGEVAVFAAAMASVNSKASRHTQQVGYRLKKAT